MQKTWLRHTGAALAVLALLAGCAGSGRGPANEEGTSKARVLLDLEAGDPQDQPGLIPGRVGGVEASGPAALAVEGSTFYIADQAKGRILKYEDGRLAGAIPAPWLEERGIDLEVTPGGLLVSHPHERYEVDLSGRILKVESPASGEEESRWSAAILLGTDRWENRYWRSLTQTGVLVDRTGPGGELLGRAEIVEWNVADYFVTPEGGAYALAWDWPEVDNGVRVYEILPPLEEPAGREARVTVPEPPEFLGHPVPTDVRLTAPNWAPVSISGDVDRWNLWQLLSDARPAGEEFQGGERSLGLLEATLPDGSEIAIELHLTYAVVDGEAYLLPYADALHAVIDAVRLSPAGLKEALAAADRVWIAIRDLPGVERELPAEEIERVAVLFEEAYPVYAYTPPQPLEEPFPVYGLSLSGQGWEGHLDLRGAHHAAARTGGWADPAAYTGGLAALLQEWLPLPELPAGSLEHLYLAQRVEMGDGVDVTRWLYTIVRHLLGVQVRQGEVANQEPLVVTFWVQGEPHIVEIDPEGFTYAGVRYERPGLTDLAHLQGVP